jgi:hypothetical protein
MSRIKLEDIREITKNPQGKGYLIIFNDNRVIILYKKRTIAALLTLIRYGEGCESESLYGKSVIFVTMLLINVQNAS